MPVSGAQLDSQILPGFLSCILVAVERRSHTMRCLTVFQLLWLATFAWAQDKPNPIFGEAVVGSEDVELLEDVEPGSDEKSEDFQYSRSHYGHQPHQPVVRTRVTVQKRILRPVVRSRHGQDHGHGAIHVDRGLGYGHGAVNIDRSHGYGHGHGAVNIAHGAVDVDHGFEGSYVAVSGRPGARTVHAVNGHRSVAIEPGFVRARPRVVHARPVADYDYYDGGFHEDSLLPKCSYINTDFEGDDVGDGRGLTTGSPYSCKQACIDQNGCRFWTFRRDWARDCYLKRGEDAGRPNNVRRRAGFVSGSRSNDCSCLRDGGDEICPTRRRGGQAFPWNRRSSRPRLDYDDYDFVDNDNDDDRDIEIATRNRDENTDDADKDKDAEADEGRRRNRNNGNRNQNRPNRNRNRNRNLSQGDGDDTNAQGDLK